LRYKKFGVTPEPEVRTQLLSGELSTLVSTPRLDWEHVPALPGAEWAYLIMVSDGISSVLSDQEVADVARSAPNPKVATEKILAFAEEMGAEDNMTAIVVPLAGWGKIKGPDSTESLREYRRRQAGPLCHFSLLFSKFGLRDSLTVGTERQKRM
jgi:protein phosphatase PTC6